jgi:hypothetical protein
MAPVHHSPAVHPLNSSCAAAQQYWCTTALMSNAKRSPAQLGACIRHGGVKVPRLAASAMCPSGTGQHGDRSQCEVYVKHT